MIPTPLVNYHGTSRRGVVSALTIFAAGLLATGYFASHERTDSQREASREFDDNCREIQVKIGLRVAAHEQILRSAAAFFADSDGISRSEWREFAERQKIDQRLPGIQGLGFAKIVPRAELGAHILSVRAEGFPAYRVWPEGEREIYTSIIFLEPFTGRNLRAFGYDMFSEPVRRAAMERARDEDAVSLTGKVQLVQEDGRDVQSGTLMYAPVYRMGVPHSTAAERRAALFGWVYSPYRMGDLITAGIFGPGDSAARQKIRLQIFDGHDAVPATLLYDSHPRAADASASPTTNDKVVEHGGRAWRLRFSSADPRGVPINYSGFWLLLGSGTIVSALLAGLVFSWANTRYAARLMAARLTQDLRESEERARTLIESSPEAIIVHRAGFIIYVNPAAVAFAGAASAADLLGTPLLDRVHPEFRPLVLGRVSQMTTAHTSVPPAEMKLLKLDGTPFDVEAQATEITYDGAPAIRVVARDVTDFKRATAALRASEENYRLLFDGMLDGFALHEIICDAAGRAVDYRFLSVNPAFERLTGLRAGDIVGRTVLEVMPTTEPVWIERYGRVVLTGEGVEFEDFSAVLNKHFEIAAFRPRPGQFATVFIDITASKRAEAALRDSEERFRVLFEGAPDAMLLADSTTGRIIDGNEAASRLLGRPRTAIIGLQQSELHPTHSHESPEAQFARHVREAEALRASVPVETSVLRPDGTEIPVEILAQTIRLQHQPVFVGTFRDITVRKKAEAALQASQEIIGGILNTIPARVFWKDKNLVYLGCNVAFAQDAGFADPQEIIGKDDFQMGWRNEAELYRADDRAVIESGTPKLFIEETQTTPDGKTIVLLTSKVPLRNATGEITGVLGTYTDITKWKESELALARSEERYRSILRASPDNITITDLSGRLVLVSPASYKMFGYSPDAEVGSFSIGDFIVPGDRERATAQLALRSRGVAVTPTEYRGLRRDGSTFDIEVNGDLVREETGRPIGFVFVIRDVTVRKQTEAALRESENRFRTLLRDIPGVAVQGYALDGTTTYWNVASEQLYGYTAEEAIGRNLLDLIIPAEMSEGVRQAMALMAATGEPIPASEILLRRKDGSRVPVFSSHSIVQNTRGAPEMFCVDIDLTARKQAEAALRASEEQFRSYIEHSPMGVFLADEAGYYVGVNQAAARTTGYAEAELLTMRVPDLAPPEASPAFDEHFQRLVQFGNSRGEVPFRRKDGSVGYWIVDAVRLAPNRVLAFTVETTERKAAEQQLAESRDLLANLARLVPGVVYQYRLYPDGRSAFPFASPGMHEIYELSPAEVQADATPVFGRLHPEDVVRVGAEIMESARTLEEFYCEFRVLLPHQGLRWRWCQAHPERTPDGGTLWHGIISDVTDRKEAELAIQTSLHEKEALLKEVHHRVKNNLQVIMSLLRMEGRRSAQPDTKLVLTEMQGRIRSMALLHESLYRSGTFAAVDLAGYLRQLASQAFRSFLATPGAIQLQLELAPVLVEMDQALPCGLLVNELVSNALKHAFPGGRAGLVRVVLQPVAGEPTRWCLAVSDDGVGLPADLEARRAQSLGLQLVADLAGQLHGALALSAAPGSGARFAVTFTIATPPPAAPAGPPLDAPS